MFKATNEEDLMYTMEMRVNRSTEITRLVPCEYCGGTGEYDVDGLPMDCPICSDGPYPGYRMEEKND